MIHLEFNRKGGNELYIVMQVENITQRDAAASYTHAPLGDKKKGTMNNLSGLIFGKKNSSSRIHKTASMPTHS